MLQFRAIGPVSTWVDILAAIKALYDLVKFGSDYTTSFLNYQQDPETCAEGRRVGQMVYNSSSDEIAAFMQDIETCRDRIIQGRPEDPARCLCSIFNNIKDGNQGVLLVGEWTLMYRELGCSSEERLDTSNPDLEDRPMDPYQKARAAKLTEAQLRMIDECILSNITHQFRKTARVVALTMGDIDDDFLGLPDVFYSGRIKHLAEAGLI